MDRRRHTRFKRRVPCELTIGEQRHSAIAMDVSLGGMYLQTTARLREVEVLQVLFPAGDGHPEILVKARTVRKKQVPAQLAAQTKPGMGLEVLECPDDYALLVHGEEFPPRFQVRVREVGGNRSRVRTVYSEDEKSAGKFVLEQLGEGWELIEVERLQD